MGCPEFEGDGLLTADEVCDLCRISRRTFDRIRAAGKGPEPTILNKFKYYRRTTVQTWIASCEKRKDAENGVES